MKKKSGRHLDLGCGEKPRNPYNQQYLCGVDIYKADMINPSVDIRVANLSLEKIPYPDDYFDSVSAFDFIEHIPRVLQSGENITRFPFVELMDEVWRVLKADGLLYASTPAYPSPLAFQDPTHVNIITQKTHKYFCGEKPKARVYGFHGKFNVVEVFWTDGFILSNSPLNTKKKIMHLFGKLTGRYKNSHLTWELRAIK